MVVVIFSLLAGFLVPTVWQARQRTRAVKCAANLRSIGQLIHGFANVHEDATAPVVRARDYYWDRGKQIGWDIETGRWAKVLGEIGGIWSCAEQQTAYVGNARALGLDNREALHGGQLHRVTRSRWHEPWRLALCYDLQYNLLDGPYAHARDPLAADLSDEMHAAWPRGAEERVVPLYLPQWGPHREAYGALFADGHARIGIFRHETDAVLWSGPKWWSDMMEKRQQKAKDSP